MGDLKSVDILDGIGNIALAHSLCIHRKYFVLNIRDISFSFRYNSRFKSSIPVTWNLNRDITDRCFQRLFGITVSPVCSFFFPTFIIRIAQMAVHFTLQHRFEHGTKNIFQRILHVLHTLWMVLIDNSLCQLTVW